MSSTTPTRRHQVGTSTLALPHSLAPTTTPLSPVEQVTALHQGMAVVVYDPDQVDDEGFEQLTSLTSGGDLVVVPADQALPERAAIAITWWETRQLCSDIDESVIENATKEAAASASRH
ncbi:MAG: DUF3105 domain-containing protein [Acidimicrobiia bacterium]|nr:DUF3105 domain-containing protein [Acidimicrobiia bacterium]